MRSCLLCTKSIPNDGSTQCWECWVSSGYQIRPPATLPSGSHELITDKTATGCDHDWVTYQPFKGDSYICCSKAGCGITQSDYISSRYADIRPMREEPKTMTYDRFDAIVKDVSRNGMSIKTPPKANEDKTETDDGTYYQPWLMGFDPDSGDN